MNYYELQREAQNSEAPGPKDSEAPGPKDSKASRPAGLNLI